jgi:MFS family permease
MSKSTISSLYLALLILAAESIFFLPYVLSRIFRPTVLEVFQIDNIQLGFCFSVYGFVAVISYLFGGLIADKYMPGKLIASSLWLTSLGGLLYASYPSYFMLKLLYGYWGFTTVFLFWAPMIKAARIWGTATSQVKSFGLLEAGRGVVGAFIGSASVVLFALFMRDDSIESTLSETRNAFTYVIYLSSGIVALVGLLVWNFMKLNTDKEVAVVDDTISVGKVFEVLRLPSVLLLMVVVLCAYMGYKTTDIIALYASEIMNYSQVESAQIATFLLYARPTVAFVLTVFFIRYDATLLLFWGFVVSLFSSFLFCTGLITSALPIVFICSILTMAIGVYGLRTLYFSVMELGDIPLLATGTAVGLISIVGYTPDVFSGPLIGY